jgi:transposase
VLGIDDWAWRKGQTYGSILVALEHHPVVDLLEDRTAATLACWWRDDPQVEIIDRDRAGAYADGARQGAPEAIQVADRFHLLMNVGEALERVDARKRVRLREVAAAVDRLKTEETSSPNASVEAGPRGSEPKPLSRAQRETRSRQDRRQARSDAVRELAG